jgi:hypothetical protein
MEPSQISLRQWAEIRNRLRFWESKELKFEAAGLWQVEALGNYQFKSSSFKSEETLALLVVRDVKLQQYSILGWAARYCMIPRPAGSCRVVIYLKFRGISRFLSRGFNRDWPGLFQCIEMGDFGGSTNPVVHRGVRSTSAESRHLRDCREWRAGRGQHVARSRRNSSRGSAQSYWESGKGVPWNLGPCRSATSCFRAPVSPSIVNTRPGREAVFSRPARFCIEPVS